MARKRIDWDSQPLGELSDYEIADRLGVTTGANMNPFDHPVTALLFALLAPVVLLAAVPVVLVYDAVRALRGRTTE